MIKIRALKSREIQQAMALLTQYCEQNGGQSTERKALKQLRQLYIPAHWVSQLLPPQWQFVPAIYVAASREHVLGLIGLSRDGEQRNRWNIDEIIIDPDVSTYDIGTQLVNFAINRYGAGGVQTFLARVFSYEDQAQGLLKSCGFRHCTRVHYFHHERPVELMGEQVADAKRFAIKGLRQAVREDAEKLQSLYNDSLPPEIRLSLEKSKADFILSAVKRLKRHLQGRINRRWVVEDVVRDVLVGSLEVSTDNHQDFHFEVFVSPGWPELYDDLLQFGMTHALHTTRNARITIEAFDFQKEQIKLLEEMVFQRDGTAEILVKDYWIPLKDKSEKLRSPLLIFDGGKTSPAVNYK